MSSLRLLTTLRSSLLSNRFYRIVSSLSGISPIDLLYSRSSIKTQQTCWFSSSNIVHARRRDKIDTKAVEELDNDDDEEKQKEEDDDDDSDQVM